MLQTVLGVDAARIASALLVSPAAMGNGLSATKSLTNRPVGLTVLSNEQDQQSESYASEDP
jgi:predicted RNA polymerase sigma factor